jgi:uncharacterized protein RhaS with RHS repeats
MKTNTLIKTAAPALLVIACLLFPQTAHCFYNPSTGRWISRDPIAEKGGRNLYCFAYNCPISKHDPLGRDSKTFNTYDGYSSYTVTIDVWPSPVFPLCGPAFGAVLMIPVSITTATSEASGMNLQDDVVMTSDGDRISVAYGNNQFTAYREKHLAHCPKGPQKGSITVTAKYHDDNYHGDLWVTALEVVVDYSYECGCYCFGDFKKPFETKFTWTKRNEKPKE